MTDRYAIVEYERIFNPRQLSFVNLIPWDDSWPVEFHKVLLMI
jgi:hypothetical protein